MGVSAITRVLIRFCLPALGLALAGCAADPRTFVPADPGPVATERFNGEIIWVLTRLPELVRVEAAFEDEVAAVRRARNAVPILPRGLVQLTLLSRDDAALLLEHTSDFPDPVRGKLSLGEGKPLYKIDYRAGTYRELQGDPEDEVRPAYRAGVTDGIMMRETSEQRVILGRLCTATKFSNFPGGRECTVWSTRSLLVNKTPLLFWEQLPGPLGIVIASVRACRS